MVQLLLYRAFRCTGALVLRTGQFFSREVPSQSVIQLK